MTSTSSDVAADLAALITAGDPMGAFTLLRPFGSEQRAALSSVVQAYGHLGDYVSKTEDIGPAGARLISAIACQAHDVAAVEELLWRNAVVAWHHQEAVLAAVLEWHADDLSELFEWLQAAQLGRLRPWDLVEGLRRALGRPYPESIAYQSLVVGHDGSGLGPIQRLHSAPELWPLVCSSFENPDIAANLGRDPNAYPRRPEEAEWPHAIAQMCPPGSPDRPAILDHAVAGAFRGGDRTTLAWWVDLNTALRPTAAEVHNRLSTYTAMLVDGPGPVASMAQAALRTLDGAGGLDIDDLCALSVSVVMRPEKRVVVAQLRWLKEVGTRDAASIPAAGCAVAKALHHPAVDIVERALGQLESWWPRLSADTRAEIAEVLADVPRSLQLRAAELTGGITKDLHAHATSAHSPQEPPPLPPPIESLDELREVIAHDPAAGDVYSLERIADGVLAFAAPGHTLWELVDSLPEFTLSYADMWRHQIRMTTASFIHLSLSPGRTGSLCDQVTFLHTRIEGGKHSVDPTCIELIAFADRLDEVIVDVRASRPRRMLSLPTHRGGRLDPNVFLTRVRAALAQANDLRPLDLQQALLRIPPGGRGQIAGLLPDLPEAARAQITAWLAGNAAAPETALYPLENCNRHPLFDPWNHRINVVVRTTGEPAFAGSLPAHLHERDTESRLLRISDYGVRFDPMIVLLLAPWNRDYAAAAITTEAVGPQFDLSVARPLLADFPYGGGCTGAATALMLSRFAVSSDGIDRLMAADAAAALSRQEELDATQWGVALGLLVTVESHPVGRIAKTLAAVASAGEMGCVWQVCLSLIPVLLDNQIKDTALILDIAADAASTVGAVGTVRGLPEVASRAGRQKLVTSARRLADVLATNATEGAAAGSNPSS